MAAGQLRQPTLQTKATSIKSPLVFSVAALWQVGFYSVRLQKLRVQAQNSILGPGRNNLPRANLGSSWDNSIHCFKPGSDSGLCEKKQEKGKLTLDSWERTWVGERKRAECRLSKATPNGRRGGVLFCLRVFCAGSREACLFSYSLWVLCLHVTLLDEAFLSTNVKIIPPHSPLFPFFPSALHALCSPTALTGFTNTP